MQSDQAKVQLSDIQISEGAARRIAFLIKDEPEGMNFRVGVDGGGCSGFKYNFGFDARKPDDLVVENQGSIVLIDPISAGFMAGSIVDFIETLGDSQFVIKNPNATASCGCGNSFAV